MMLEEEWHNIHEEERIKIKIVVIKEVMSDHLSGPYFGFDWVPKMKPMYLPSILGPISLHKKGSGPHGKPLSHFVN